MRRAFSQATFLSVSETAWPNLGSLMRANGLERPSFLIRLLAGSGLQITSQSPHASAPAPASLRRSQPPARRALKAYSPCPSKFRERTVINGWQWPVAFARSRGTTVRRRSLPPPEAAAHPESERRCSADPLQALRRRPHSRGGASFQAPCAGPPAMEMVRCVGRS